MIFRELLRTKKLFQENPFFYFRAIAFLNVPMPSTVTSTLSPSCNHTGGSRENPTPSGVPVSRREPFGNVVPCDKNESSSGTLKIISPVFDSCKTVPLTFVCSFKLFGSLTLVARHGPRDKMYQMILHDSTAHHLSLHLAIF